MFSYRGCKAVSAKEHMVSGAVENTRMSHIVASQPSDGARKWLRLVDILGLGFWSDVASRTSSCSRKRSDKWAPWKSTSVLFSLLHQHGQSYGSVLISTDLRALARNAMWA